jgi:glycosidase
VESPFLEFYTRLLNLYQKTPALYAGEFIKVPSDNDANVYAYLRRDGAQKVFVVLNLSADPQSATLSAAAITGQYSELFTDAKMSLAGKAAFTLQPWEYRVYVSQPN